MILPILFFRMHGRRCAHALQPERAVIATAGLLDAILTHMTDKTEETLEIDILKKKLEEIGNRVDDITFPCSEPDPSSSPCANAIKARHNYNAMCSSKSISEERAQLEARIHEAEIKLNHRKQKYESKINTLRAAFKSGYMAAAKGNALNINPTYFSGGNEK